MKPSELPTAKSKGRDLHLLSIEGRGICGLTALVTLKEILWQFQYLKKLPQPPRPCDVFDLAGGIGTGGIITIMLFRLGMTVDEAIVAYAKLSEEVFSKSSVLSHKKTNASRLENSIAEFIQSSLKVDKNQSRNECMLDDKGPKCFVSATTAINASPTLFRTYVPPHTTYNCTIVEAVRATTAEDPFFPSIDIGDANLKEMFIHVGSRKKNPVRALLEEAVSIFPGQYISCVLSIGSGAQGTNGLETTSTAELAKVLSKVLNDSDRISDEVAKELSDKDTLYCRLNVDHGLEAIGFEDWERLRDVKTHTQKYLEKYDTTQKVSRLVQVLNRRTGIASTAKDTLMVLCQFLDGLISVPAEESWSMMISELIWIIEPGKVATETLNIQCALLRDTLESCMQGRNFGDLPDDFRGNIQQLLNGLKKMFQASSRQEDPVMHITVNIQQLLQQFWVQNHIAGNIMLHDILKHIQRDDPVKQTFTRLEQHAVNQNLGTLNVAPLAAYDSFEVSEKPSCFKGTRVKLLNEIASWIAGDDPTLSPIYVLDGVAGIGKTTVAKTVAEYAAGINVLGASFFFSRNDDKRKTATTFFPTIAYQLAYYDMAFADEINNAVVPHVVVQTPVKQFSTLIMGPLERFLTVAENPILIIIDALDECEHNGDTLLNIFAHSIKKMPRLKLFVTTRPEYHIRRVLDQHQHLKRFHLQDIEKLVVESDIWLYLDFHLSESQVRDKLPELKCIWKPAKKDLNVLLGMCGTLFVIASTAVKFILDNKKLNPARQLSRLLNGVSNQDLSASKHMDSLYTQILLAAVPNNDDDSDGDGEDDWFGHYRIVVGTIVALQYPLPCLALLALLNFDYDDVVRALSHLYSLVAPTGHDLTFRIHHKSFPDFVTSPSRCKFEPRFFIDLKMCHMLLGKRCLRLMDFLLKPNIRNLGTIDHFKDNASDVQHLTHDHISQELAYASTHWATHLANVSKLDDEVERLLEDFACKHLLAWLELLSVIGRVEIAYPSLDRILKLLDGLERKTGITREIFRDGCRFIALNIDLIKIAAGHVYSAFAFTPKDTKLYATYKGMQGINLDVVSGYDRQWNPTISVMTGHERQVSFVTFSGDGTRLASASADKTVRVWDGETGAEIFILRGHSKSVNSVVFSPEATTLASGSADKTVRLWDAQTGAELGVLRGHSKSVYSVAFSPDGARLASASADKTVRLWDGQTGAEISILRGHSDEINYVAFSPNGTLASASEDGTVRLWDGVAGAKIAILQGHSNSVYFVVFSVDGTRLASASADKTIRLWDGKTGAKIAVFRGHSDEVDSVVFSPNGTRLASASEDGTVRLWDAQSGTEMAVLRGHSNSVYSVVFSLDGTLLGSASADGAVRLWDPETGAEIAVLRGHSDEVNLMVFSPNGTTLASVSEDRTVRLWDAQTNAQMKYLPGRSKSVKSIVFSPDGTTLASASTEGTVRLWNGQTGAKIAVVRGHSDWVNSVVFSPNGTTLASVSEDGTVRLWDGQTGAEMGVLRGHSNAVYSVEFSPDGTRIASASADGTVRLWNHQSGNKTIVLRGHSDEVNWVVFSPDGTKLASASEDGMVRLWNSKTGANIAVLRGHSNSVHSVVFSPNGMTLASASADGTVRLWDPETCANITVLRGHSDEINSVVFSPDSTRLASASEDGTARLWDVQTASEIVVLRGQLEEVNLVSFSPDGMTLASGSSDGIVRLWDGHTGAENFILRGHSDEVNAVVFSPDGTRLGSSSEDGMIRLWSAQTGTEISVLQGHSLWVKSVAFSRDGRRLASASEDGAAHLWDPRTTTDIAILRGHTDLIYSVMFSPDGTILASAAEDGTVRLWDGQTGTEITVLGGHPLWVKAVVFSPDCTKLASASDDRTVRLWNAQTGAETAVLRGHSDQISFVVFSPDGGRLASASDDRTVRLWDIQSDAVIFVLRGHTNSVSLVVFSPDGTTLATASEDGTVRLWDAQTGVQNASYPGFVFADLTLDGSKLLSIDAEEVYLVCCITGDKVTVPLGTLINLHAGVRVPGLDLWVVCVNRKRPSLQGLLVVKVDHNGDLCFTSLCWFPPNLSVVSFAVSSLSQVAIGCDNGHVLLLDIDFPSLL